MALEYDALVSVSGDGLIHEVMNGFAQHPQSAEAFRIPIAPIPTGSGNGTSLNLLGIEVCPGSVFQMNLFEMRLSNCIGWVRHRSSHLERYQRPSHESRPVLICTGEDKDDIFYVPVTRPDGGTGHWNRKLAVDGRYAIFTGVH